MKTPVHIPCATSGNVQVGCALRRVGDLLRLCGYGTMDFTPDDAMDLARNVALIAVECGYRKPDDLAQFAAFWRHLAVECGGTIRWRTMGNDRKSNRLIGRATQ